MVLYSDLVSKLITCTYFYTEICTMVIKLCQHITLIKSLQVWSTLLYPTYMYDVDQSTASEYICGSVLWLGKYHDIALWYTLVACRIHKPVNTPQAGQSEV